MHLSRTVTFFPCCHSPTLEHHVWPEAHPQRDGGGRRRRRQDQPSPDPRGRRIPGFAVHDLRGRGLSGRQDINRRRGQRLMMSAVQEQ